MLQKYTTSNTTAVEQVTFLFWLFTRSEIVFPTVCIKQYVYQCACHKYNKININITIDINFTALDTEMKITGRRTWVFSVTYVNSCLGSSASFSPYSSTMFSEGDICSKGRRVCSCGKMWFQVLNADILLQLNVQMLIFLKCFNLFWTKNSSYVVSHTVAAVGAEDRAALSFLILVGAGDSDPCWDDAVRLQDVEHFGIFLQNVMNTANLPTCFSPQN